MKPSVGRIVLVPMDPVFNNGARVAPAIIVRVWDDRCLNVKVLGDNVITEWRTSVMYVESLDDAEGDHFWSWPPRV